MSARILTALGLIAFTAPAFAAPDLTVTLTAPTLKYVYQTGRYTATVKNVGNQTANSASVVIQLPETATSPTVHIMGTVTGKSAACTQSGTKLTCALGSIQRNKSKSVYVDIALPHAVDPMVFEAVAAFPGEPNTANNDDSLAAVLRNYSVAFTAPRTIVNQHCTGTALSSFYECTLYPSSISSHEIVLNPNGTVSIVGEPDYEGTWSRSGPTQLSFTYTYLGDVVAEFVGHGVDASCFEGMTTFPGSSYVSMYEACLN